MKNVFNPNITPSYTNKSSTVVVKGCRAIVVALFIPSAIKASSSAEKSFYAGNAEVTKAISNPSLVLSISRKSYVGGSHNGSSPSVRNALPSGDTG